jgi:hypothetical protein
MEPNKDFTLEINPDELREIATAIESQTHGFVNFENKVLFTHRPLTTKKPVIWPGNEISCTGENSLIHDYLCELLDQMGYSEQDVCTASVGIWGAIQVMNEKLAVSKRETEILKAVNTGLLENIERHSKTIGIIDKELQEARKIK